MGIVLNMIVKNESRVLRRLLESCLGIVDAWVIVDTGSTDITPQLIQSFMKEHGIPGFLQNRPFDNFGSSRTHALQLCPTLFPQHEWVLLLDADMILKCTDVAGLRTRLGKALQEGLMGFHMFQGDNSFQTKNIRVVRNVASISYWGVTHEYVNFPEGAASDALLEPELVRILDIGDGGSKGNKAARDVDLLTRGLEEEPGNARYLFYLANTYADMEAWALAIETYDKRIGAGAWYEEIWYSHYRKGECWLALGETEKAVASWLAAYEVMPERVENICQIVKVYREAGQNRLAYLFCKWGKQCLPQDDTCVPDVLFVHSSMYRYWLDYEMTIVGYYWNPDRVDLAGLAMSLLAKDDFCLDSGFLDNLLSNYKYYAPHITSLGSHTNISLPDVLVPTGWSSSTPSVAWGPKGKLVCLVRVHNYRVNKDDGRYECVDTIETRNYLCKDYDWKQGQGVWKEVNYDNKELDNCYVGVEDMRIYADRTGWNLCFTGNRGLVDGRMRVQFGLIYDDDEEEIIKTSSVLLQYNESQTCEKNWVLFVDKEDTTMVVYGWHPLVIGCIEEGDQFVETHRIKTPAFFSHLRGSSHGVEVVPDELWFLCHLVSHEERRYYYHIFVILDKESLVVKKTSKLFTFGGQPVEYSCGFVVNNDHLLIGFSQGDSSSNIANIPLSEIPFSI